MMLFTLGNSLIFICLTLVSQIFSQTARRDDTWPPRDVLELLKPIRISCMSKTGVTEESLKEFSDGEIHDDEALKCYMNCMFHEYTVVDDNGDVHLEKLYAKIPDSVSEKFFKMAQNCEHPEGDTLCQKAWWFHQCWKKADPVHYFLP